MNGTPGVQELQGPASTSAIASASVTGSESVTVWVPVCSQYSESSKQQLPFPLAESVVCVRVTSAEHGRSTKGWKRPGSVVELSRIPPDPQEVAKDHRSIRACAPPADEPERTVLT